MAQEKRLKCPKIVVSYAAEPSFSSRDEAWKTVLPLLADVLAQLAVKERIKLAEDVESSATRPHGK